MTKTRSQVKHAVKTKSKDLVGNDKDFYRVLKILKDDDELTFYLDKKYFKGEKSRVSTLLHVEKNLFSGNYSDKPWSFIRDVNTSFNHILSINKKNTKVYRNAIWLQETFSREMDEIMKKLGYCCGKWYEQKARNVSCYGAKQCVVQVNTVYFRFQEWTYCNKCFEKFPEDINLTDDLVARKSQFIEFFFKAPEPEKFARCFKCQRKFHEVCVLYEPISGIPFYCSNCRETQNIQTFPVRANTLPSTECDVFIENFLKTHVISEGKSISIRLLSSMEKAVNVNKNCQDFRAGSNKYPFRDCTLFCFFDTGQDTDICFYAIFFQLYGMDCPEPNRNTAYISYIDSNHLLPSSNRTKIYKIILLGLFAYIKTKGYSSIYLWSCPPKQNQDYIFYMKPTTMKMPTKERLSKWYLELFKLGIELKVIDSFKGIQEHANVENWKNINNIPLIEGDLWVTRVDEAVTTVRKESKKLQDEEFKLRERLKVAEGKKKIATMTQLKAKRKQIQEYNKNARLWNLMTTQMRGFNLNYFVIQLHATESANQEHETIERKWMNDRHNLIDFFWEQILEFSSERRAQFTTYIMLWRLFVESSICVKCAVQAANGINGSLLCQLCSIISDKVDVRTFHSEFYGIDWSPTVDLVRCDELDVIENNEEENQQMDQEVLQVENSWQELELQILTPQSSNCFEEMIYSNYDENLIERHEMSPDSGINGSESPGMSSAVSTQNLLLVDGIVSLVSTELNELVNDSPELLMDQNNNFCGILLETGMKTRKNNRKFPFPIPIRNNASQTEEVIYKEIEFMRVDLEPEKKKSKKLPKRLYEDFKIHATRSRARLKTLKVP